MLNFPLKLSVKFSLNWRIGHHYCKNSYTIIKTNVSYFSILFQTFCCCFFLNNSVEFQPFSFVEYRIIQYYIESSSFTQIPQFFTYISYWLIKNSYFRFYNLINKQIKMWPSTQEWLQKALLIQVYMHACVFLTCFTKPADNIKC